MCVFNILVINLQFYLSPGRPAPFGPENPDISPAKIFLRNAACG